jgi:2-octaprenyl-6-methoxyphenol hydroxylase
MTPPVLTHPPMLDVLISGGGIPGLCLAVALARELADGVKVAVCDPWFGQRRRGTRASAIAAGSRHMLERLGVWAEMGAQAQPILGMIITDSRIADPTRPAFLSFEGELEPGEPFAHMVFNDDLADALEAAAGRAGVELIPLGVSGHAPGRGGSSVTLEDGTVRRARLVVAADGAGSRLREAAGIRMLGWDYRQVGIVATVAHEREHDGRAEEHFLPAGPFAILPLPGRRSSIVWTEHSREATRLLELRPNAFLLELKRRFGHRLGELTLLDVPRAVRLGLRVARAFVSDRLALVGDAAHVIHPIAGQGLNLGLRDVAVLAECIAGQMSLGLDPADPGALARYERARRFDTTVMAASTDVLNRLFSNDELPARLARDFGLGVVDRLPVLKRFFVREAAGMTGTVPALMRALPHQHRRP